MAQVFEKATERHARVQLKRAASLHAADHLFRSPEKKKTQKPETNEELSKKSHVNLSKLSDDFASGDFHQIFNAATDLRKLEVTLQEAQKYGLGRRCIAIRDAATTTVQSDHSLHASWMCGGPSQALAVALLSVLVAAHLAVPLTLGVTLLAVLVAAPVAVPVPMAAAVAAVLDLQSEQLLGMVRARCRSEYVSETSLQFGAICSMQKSWERAC